MSEKTVKLQRPYLDEEARAKLGDYVDAGDRDPPLFFTGREEIIERITRTVDRCCSKQHNDSNCYTLTIAGAPGAGKTSLLREIEKRINRTGDAVAVVIDGSELTASAGLANKLLDGYRSHFKLDDGVITQQQVDGYGGPWYAIQDHNPSINWDSTACLLMIDESNGIPGIYQDSYGNWRNPLVMALHMGQVGTHALKIVPVFVGLSDLKMVLAHRGASRLRGGDANCQLEALTHDESVAIVSRWMRHEPFGFEGVFADSDIDLVSNKVAVASEGWPLHITTHLSLLGQEILRQSDVPNAGIDLDAILDRGSDDKIRYYETCLSTADLGDYARVICDAAEKSEKNIVEFENLHDVATKEYGIDSSDVYALHEKAVKAGVFDDAVSSPRPESFKFSTLGFRTYMSVARDPAPFKATMRQQMDLAKC